MIGKPIFQVVIGNVLKVMKKDFSSSPFMGEFNAIRHGDYWCFVKLVQGNIPPVVVYNKGHVSFHEELFQTDFDYLALLKAGPSMLNFHQKIKKHYGSLTDPDLPDNAFELMAYFEITMRMHAKNHNLYKGRLDLNQVIDRLCEHYWLSAREKNILHENRDILNQIKHPNGIEKDWSLDIKKMNELIRLLNDRKLLVSSELAELI